VSCGCSVVFGFGGVLFGPVVTLHSRLDRYHGRLHWLGER